MVWTIAVILLVLWALGLVSAYTMGGFIHILLVLAILVVLVRVIQGGASSSSRPGRQAANRLVPGKPHPRWNNPKETKCDPGN